MIAHVLWICVCISLILALSLAYVNSLRPDLFDRSLSSYDNTFPAQFPNVTITSNSTTKVTEIEETKKVPIIPLFVLNWGYIGAAVYVLKVVTEKLLRKQDFKNSYIPIHVARLFIGPAIAVVVYFVIISGGVFGLTIDITKISPQYIQYVYAAISFLSGYFVRRIVEKFSDILDSIFGKS